MSDEKITKSSSIIPPETRLSAESGGRENRHEQREESKTAPAEEVKDHYDEFSRLMEIANTRLENDASPFRFGLRREGEEIIIDLVKINASGEDSSVLYRNITHQAFHKAVEHVLEGHGLVLDLLG